MSLSLAPKPYEQMPYAGDGNGYRPGDWMLAEHAISSPCRDWDNCSEVLYVVLPCGCLFDCSHRAKNCGSPQDRTHRCWVITGIPPNVTLSKSGGPTCNAGGGSIGHPHWHGWLCRGILSL